MTLLQPPRKPSSLATGKLTAMLAFLAAAFELLAHLIEWTFFHTNTLDMFLLRHSASMPILLSGPHAPSFMAQALLFLFDLIPTLLISLAFCFAGMFFRNLAKAEVWSERNVRLLWRTGVLCVCTPLAYTATVTLQSVALSIDLPAAERGADFMLDLSLPSLSQVVLGLLLCAFSRLMGQARLLSEENAKFI